MPTPEAPASYWVLPYGQCCFKIAGSLPSCRELDNPPCVTSPLSSARSPCSTRSRTEARSSAQTRSPGGRHQREHGFAPPGDARGRGLRRAHGRERALQARRATAAARERGARSARHAGRGAAASAGTRRRDGRDRNPSAPGDRDAVTVDFVQSASSVQSVARVGRPSVGHATATGKVMLAFGKAKPAPGQLKAFTKRTITDSRRLAAELERVRRVGFAEAMRRARRASERHRRADLRSTRRARGDHRRPRPRAPLRPGRHARRSRPAAQPGVGRLGEPRATRG